MSQSFFPIAVALRQSLKNGYDLKTFRSDLVAAVVAALVALPLAMALSIAVGLPPQNGLYTAIIAGILVPLLGGSRSQVSGPTAAFVVIVAPIITSHGLEGLIIATIMAGIMLFLMGLAKLGRYINYIPYPVIIGFTSGIAVVIGTLAINDLLGLGIKNFQGDYLHKISLIMSNLHNFSWVETLIGLVTLLVMLFANKAKIPSTILGILVGVALSLVLEKYGFHIANIGNRFSYTLASGVIMGGVPPYLPEVHLFKEFDWQLLKTLFPSAIVIALLAALESLLSATAADGIAKTKHQPNSELIAIGIGNICSAFFAGIPATGAIARTSTIIHSGAKTPLASTMHALIILISVVFFAHYLSYIPMASLAALLIYVAIRMSHYKQFMRVFQIAPASDSFVLFMCFAFTVLIDMTAGVTVGVVLSCFLLVKRISGLVMMEVSHPSVGTHKKLAHIKLPKDVMVYHINGSLFFGTVEEVLGDTSFINPQINTLVIDIEDVPLIDMSGLVAMSTMILDLQARNIKVILVGHESITEKIVQKVAHNGGQPFTVTPKLASVF
ncbi:MAG: SulP family inorganic anion transporter [Rickettsiales bacterium]